MNAEDDYADEDSPRSWAMGIVIPALAILGFALILTVGMSVMASCAPEHD